MPSPARRAATAVLVPASLDSSLTLVPVALAAATVAPHITHGTRPQLKAMAHRVITAQSREISDMTSWLKTWYGLTPAQAAARVPGGVGQMMRSMQADMGAMSSHRAPMQAGAGVDQAFMEAMISHHEAAVLAAGTVPGRATHSRLTALGHSIATTQNAEITQLRTWLRNWYGKSTTR